MPDKETTKPSEEITKGNPEELKGEELDEAQGGASLSRTSVGSPQIIKPIGTGLPGIPTPGSVFDTVYGGTSSINDTPLKR